MDSFGTSMMTPWQPRRDPFFASPLTTLARDFDPFFGNFGLGGWGGLGSAFGQPFQRRGTGDLVCVEGDDHYKVSACLPKGFDADNLHLNVNEQTGELFLTGEQKWTDDMGDVRGMNYVRSSIIMGRDADFTGVRAEIDDRCVDRDTGSCCSKLRVHVPKIPGSSKRPGRKAITIVSRPGLIGGGGQKGEEILSRDERKARLRDELRRLEENP